MDRAGGTGGAADGRTPRAVRPGQGAPRRALARVRAEAEQPTVDAAELAELEGQLEASTYYLAGLVGEIAQQGARVQRRIDNRLRVVWGEMDAPVYRLLSEIEAAIPRPDWSIIAKVQTFPWSK